MQSQAGNHSPKAISDRVGQRPEEGRAAARIRSVLKAEIRFNDGMMSAPCLVRDISETGARIELAGDIQLPENFDLFIAKRNESRPVHMKWRRGLEVGVAFAAAEQPRPASDVEERLAALEGELAQLRQALAQIAAALQKQ